MMGLRDFSYWASWLTYYSIVNLMISLSSWAILVFGVDTKSEWWVILLIIWLFGQSIFGIILIAQSLFSKSRAAAITTTLIYFGSSIFQYFVLDGDVDWSNRIFASFSPTVALQQTINVLGQFESSQVGLNMDNLFSEYHNYSVGWGLIMLLFDNIWLLIIGLYVEQIMPKKFGRSRNPCFIFQCKEFWGCCKGNANKIRMDDEDRQMMIDQSSANPDTVEQIMAFETK